MLTSLQRYQFLGMITIEYLLQIIPVKAKATVCVNDSLSAGLLKSPKPAITSPHFIVGAQKNIVFGLRYYCCYLWLRYCCYLA
jgi:hypothetical protein